MTNPVTYKINKDDGTGLFIIIEPMLENTTSGLQGTGIYKLYKDAFGDETTIFTEPREMNEGANELADNDNPDYVGKITLTEANWTYEGDLLNKAEQQQLADHIKTLQ